ncbi:MAG: hypothetical protein K2H79_06330 [Bacteroidaceae bacterium]|nr:hypothetical protein [Bacteroidaceae bacterium]
MRTQKYFQVEAIVAKYKNLASNTEAAKKTQSSFTDFYIPQDFARLDFVEQLLGHIYLRLTGEKADADVVKKYSTEASYYVKGLLEESEEQYLVENFAEFVNYALNNSSTVYSAWGEVFDRPEEWSCLVPYLLNNKSGKVFIAHSDGGREFIGLEECELTVCGDYEDAAIRALAHGHSISKYQYHVADGESWHDDDIADGMYDVAIVDMHTEWKEWENFKKNADFDRFFNTCTRIVKEGGEILLCLSKNVILDDVSAAMRSILKKERLLQEAILLPSGNILLHIVKKSQDSFVMCDAKDLYKKNGSGTVDVDTFVKEVQMVGMPERDICPIMQRYGYDTLDENMLLPSYYLHFPQEGSSIGDVSTTVDEFVLSDECNPKEKVVTVNHLSAVFTKGEFKVAKLPVVKQDRLRRYYRVHGPAVVIAVSEQNIAVGYTEEDADFLVPKNMYVLTPSSRVHVRYLAAIMLRKSVISQIVALVSGKGIYARLANNWVNYIRIETRPLHEQQQFVQSVILKDYALQELNAKKQEQGFKHAIRLRKHALIQNISAFDSLFRSLEYCMSDHNGHIKASDQISPISPLTVGEAMGILHSELETISYRVEHLTDNNDWGDCEAIEPQDFIEAYEHTHKQPGFKFVHLWEPFETNIFSKDILDKKTDKLLFHKGESMNTAWFPRKALQQVFDNIVANAREHGFNDKERKDYVIQTSWNTDGLNMLIKVSNNGYPLPTDVDSELLLEYGYSTALNQNGHSGIGGGEIAEIMHKFGGDVRIISSPKKKFTVTYVLTMPLASLY